MNDSQKPSWTATETDRRNQRLIVAWSLAWVLPFLGVSYAIENEWIGTGSPAIIATVAVTLLGLGALFAFHRFLRDTDELMRKIQLDALALTVGIGLVSGFSYSLLERAGVVAETGIMILIMVMVVTYIISVVVGLRRYA